MVYNVLLIGSGNVGSRHVQGILKSKYNINLHIVEINAQSIKITKKRILEVKNTNKKIYFHKSLKFKKKFFDLSIIATNAYGRLNIIKKMLKYKKIKYCIIEKIAFQTIKDYKKSIELLKINGVNSWVNCARNYHPVYNLIKKNIEKRKKILMHIKGNSWNMASNSIHFIELFNYIAPRNIDGNYLISKDNVILKSKKSGYLEIKGVFKIFNVFGDKLILEDRDIYKKYDLKIIIKNLDNKFLINETSHVLESNIFKKKIYNFKELKQSNLSKKYFDGLVEKGKILLPTLNESLQSHKSLFKLISESMNLKKNNFKNFPIT
jgi:hypothetical protein